LKVRIYPLLRGIASYILPPSFFSRPGSGGTFSSEYCYSVWLRHLHYLMQNNLFSSADKIKQIAEIGPGDTLGIGLSAIYSGADAYYAFDVIEHANLQNNLVVNTLLKDYFINHSEIPNTHRQRFTFPIIPDYRFPKEILKYPNDFYEERHLEIEKALNKQETKDIKIQYTVPWMNNDTSRFQNLDLIFSQAVMEHVSDIEYAYSEMFKWLKPGGVISHQIDFKTHEMTKEWNGHWYISEKMWEILARGRKYPMNRLPLSSHIAMIEKAGFKIKFVLPVVKPNTFKGISPVVPGVDFTEEDLRSSGALIQAIKE
jgi:hypothetical protein